MLIGVPVRCRPLPSWLAHCVFAHLLWGISQRPQDRLLTVLGRGKARIPSVLGDAPYLRHVVSLADDDQVIPIVPDEHSSPRFTLVRWGFPP